MINQYGKIVLSYRELTEQPWEKVDEKYPVSSIVKGTVSRIALFGAFVSIEPGVEGMIHISELAHHRVIAVKNVVKEGQNIFVKILTCSCPVIFLPRFCGRKGKGKNMQSSAM